MQISSILAILHQHYKDTSTITIAANTLPPGLVVLPEQLIEVCHLLHTHPDLYFDYLACITALDNGPTVGTLEVIYQLYSIPYNHSLMLKVSLPRDQPDCKLPSVTSIWQAANWHEREAYDLLGVHFEGHPALRRILLPEDWIGHPLRTDYKPPTTYHGIETENS